METNDIRPSVFNFAVFLEEYLRHREMLNYASLEKYTEDDIRYLFRFDADVEILAFCVLALYEIRRKREELKKIAELGIAWIKKYADPHVQILIDVNSIEALAGVMAENFDDTETCEDENEM
jgi:hypothetical protein